MLKKTLIAGLAVAATLALAACSSGADAEAKFLEQVHAEIDVTISDEALVSMTKNACQALKDDDRMKVMGIALTSGMDVDDASWALGVGVGNLCPDQGDKLG